MNLDDLKGRRALVTGAGDGIGAMLARGFAALGMDVIVQDIRAQAAEAVATEIGGTPMVFDVSDRQAALAAAAQIDGPLNLLWLNAGVGVGLPLLGGKPNGIEWALSVNALGVVWTAQAFVPLVEQATGPAHVGVTASSASLRPPEGDYPFYAMTKHATFAIGETLRGELADKGIGTTILCPGLLNTNIWDGAKARPDRFGGPRHMDPVHAKLWRDAKTPDLMWPHIKGVLEKDGGYLACLTDDGDTHAAFKTRMAEIEAGMVEI